MPDHTPTGVLSSSTGHTGRTDVTVLAGARALVVQFTTLPPLGRLEAGIGTIGPYYGVGHYTMRIQAYPGAGIDVITGGGPLRYSRHYLPLPTGHETQINVWVPAGGVYSVYLVD